MLIQCSRLHLDLDHLVHLEQLLYTCLLDICFHSIFNVSNIFCLLAGLVLPIYIQHLGWVFLFLLCYFFICSFSWSGLILFFILTGIIFHELISVIWVFIFALTAAVIVLLISLQIKFFPTRSFSFFLVVLLFWKPPSLFQFWRKFLIIWNCLFHKKLLFLIFFPHLFPQFCQNIKTINFITWREVFYQISITNSKIWVILFWPHV